MEYQEIIQEIDEIYNSYSDKLYAFFVALGFIKGIRGSKVIDYNTFVLLLDYDLNHK